MATSASIIEVVVGLADSITTILANLIAIGVFVFSINPIRNWARALREDVTEVRRQLQTGDEGPGEDIVMRRQQLRITSAKPDDKGRFRISWGANAIAETARILPSKLRQKLSSSKGKPTDIPIVADVRFFRPDNDQSKVLAVEVIKLHYLDDNSRINRIKKFFYRHRN